MGGLGGSGEVESVVGNSGGFSCAVQAGEFGVIGQEAVGSFAHFAIGFDAEDAIAVLQKQTGEDASAAGDIGDHGVRSESAFVAQSFEDLRRVAGTVTNVVFDAIGETKGGIGVKHGDSLTNAAAAELVSREFWACYTIVRETAAKAVSFGMPDGAPEQFAESADRARMGRARPWSCRYALKLGLRFQRLRFAFADESFFADCEDVP